MATDKPKKLDVLLPLHEGELWRITGIAEATAKRLHAAGIDTFAQLASLSPEEIASTLPGQVGVKERASRQDWIGQARKFSESVDTADINLDQPAEQPVEAGERQHYESFLIELLLEDDRSVRRTRVTNVRGGQKEGWAGWDPSRLNCWLLSSSGIKLDTLAPGPMASADPGKPQPQLRLCGVLKQSGYTLTQPGGSRLGNFYAPDLPLELRLCLDLASVEVPTGMDLMYQAQVYAQPIGANQRLLIGNLSGDALGGAQIDLILPLQGLTEGTYRLEIRTVVYPAASIIPDKEGLTMTQESGLFHIYTHESIAVN